MKNLASILFVLTAALGSGELFAATAQVNSIIQFGGKTDGANTTTIPLSSASKSLIFLSAHIPASNQNYQAFYNWGAASNSIYQVTAGKTFVIMGMWLRVAGANDPMIIGQATATFTNNGSSTDPTGATWFSGAKTIPMLYGDNSGAAAGYKQIPIGGQFQSGNFPFLLGTSGANGADDLIIMGQEF